MTPTYQYAGLGDAATQITGTTGGLISAGIGVGVATGAVAAGTALATIGLVAGPIGAIAGVLIGILEQVFSGCGQSCTLTSQAANQIEQTLQQNLLAYQASGHTKSEQAAALANFDYAWGKLQQYCGQASFGAAGQRCTTDRQRGACKWTNDGHGGPAGSGNVCWNWFVGYRDPIANDPNVQPDTAATANIGATVQQALGLTSGNYTPIIIGLAAILILVVVTQ